MEVGRLNVLSRNGVCEERYLFTHGVNALPKGKVKAEYVILPGSAHAPLPTSPLPALNSQDFIHT